MLAKGLGVEQRTRAETMMMDGKDRVPFVMDIKLDGERMLVHKRGDELRLLTRKGTDYTPKYEPIIGATLRERIGARDAILDGEMLSVDLATGDFVAFGHNREVALAELKRAKEAGGAARGGGGGGGKAATMRRRRRRLQRR